MNTIILGILISHFAFKFIKGVLMENERVFWGHEVVLLLRQMNENLIRIERRLRPVGVPDSIRLYTIIDGRKTELKMLPLAQGKVAKIDVEILDAAGNPAKVDGELAWGLSDDSMGAIEASGLSAIFKPAGKVGLVKIFCKADADLGEGVREIVGEGEIEVLSGEAVLLNLKLEAQDPA